MKEVEQSGGCLLFLQGSVCFEIADTNHIQSQRLSGKVEASVDVL